MLAQPSVTNPMSKKFSIVMPVFNEESSLAKMLTSLLDVNIQNLEKEIIIVNDGSTDGTAAILEQFRGRCKIYTHVIQQGKGAALSTGLKYATGDILGITDADLEYDPEDFNQVVEPILKGRGEVVYGSRRLKENPNGLWLYYLGNLFFKWALHFIFRVHLTDYLTATKALTRPVFEKICLTGKGFQFESQLVAQIIKNGYKIMEVPINYHPRNMEEGKNIRWWHGFSMLKELLRERFRHSPVKI